MPITKKRSWSQEVTWSVVIFISAPISLNRNIPLLWLKDAHKWRAGIHRNSWFISHSYLQTIQDRLKIDQVNIINLVASTILARATSQPAFWAWSNSLSSLLLLTWLIHLRRINGIHLYAWVKWEAIISVLGPDERYSSVCLFPMRDIHWYIWVKWKALIVTYESDERYSWVCSRQMRGIKWEFLTTRSSSPVSALSAPSKSSLPTLGEVDVNRIENWLCGTNVRFLVVLGSFDKGAKELSPSFIQGGQNFPSGILTYF